MLDSIRANAQSFGVKLAFGIIIVVFVFWGIGSYSGGPQVVATINGEKISDREFATAYQQLAGRYMAAYPGITSEMLNAMGLEQQVLQSLVSVKLLEQESQRTGIDVPPHILRMYLEAIPELKDAQGNFDRARYEAELKRARPGVPTPDNIRREFLPTTFQEVIGAAAWANPVTARNLFDYEGERRQVAYIMFPSVDFEAAATPTEDEISTAYASRENVYTVPARVRLEYIRLNPASMGDPASISAEEVASAYQDRIAQYTTPEQVKARHILIGVAETASEDQVKAAEETVRSIRARIAGGEDFAEVAKETGQDGTAPEGGDLGWFTHSQMVQEFADAAFALAPGGLSEPVRSRFGYHLILVEEKKPEEVRPLQDVEEELRAQLAAQAVSGKIQGLAEEALGVALGNNPMEEAARVAGVPVETTDLVAAEDLGGLGIQSGDVELIMSAPAGQVIGKVLTTNDGLGVVKVVEALPRSVKPLEEVKDDVIFWLTREKSRNLAKEAAEAARQAFQDARPGMEYLQRIQTTQPFDRQGYIAELGMSMDLVKDVFALPRADAGSNKWLANAYTVDEGAVLVTLDAVVLPSDEEWVARKDETETMIRQERATGLFSIYLDTLNKSAKVTYNPELVSRLVSEMNRGIS